jgi:1,4-dihydroxy-2-naphthoate octaprenyltransferase
MMKNKTVIEKALLCRYLAVFIGIITLLNTITVRSVFLSVTLLVTAVVVMVRSILLCNTLRDAERKGEWIE